MNAMWRALSHIAMVNNTNHEINIFHIHHRVDGEYDVEAHYYDHPHYFNGKK